MKIATLTLNGHYNYGNRLQIYALTSYIKRFGTSNNLWWSGNYNLFSKKNFSLKEKLKFISNYNNFQKQIIFNNKINAIREFKIKRFSDTKIDIKTVDINDVHIANQYDYFIVGSDQIWNPLFWCNTKEYEKAMFLKFAPKEKKIAYAASIGLESLPKHFEKIFTKNIEEIEHISVREIAGAEIIEKLTGRKVPVVIDPTLLLSTNEWTSIEQKPVWYNNEEYILTYFLGDMPESLVKFSKFNNCRIYNLMDPDDINLYVSSVEEFLYLVHHAKLFCTDSFHGCVFSIIFKIPFMVVKRKEKNCPNMMSRLDTLFQIFHLSSQYCDFSLSKFDFEMYLHPDFSNVDSILKNERTKSLNFFKNAMNL
ncbi:MAG: polysaccharide pyruvyl transferase family protein [Succinivibrio sp.]|nr:polysaccharide pyruvyl transferase family protein [Succinivibrio sp.]